MAVRAIFYVEEVSEKPGGIGTAKLRAVAKGPYASWSKYTPFGELNLGTLNENAFAWFREHLGADVAITFDDPTPDDLAT